MPFFSGHSLILAGDIEVPYKNKYWRGTKFGEFADCHAIAKFKFHQYFVIAHHSGC